MLMESEKNSADSRLKCNTRPSSPFGLRPHCDEGRVLHFSLESALTLFQHIDFQVEVRVVERQSDVPFVMVYGAGLLVPNLP